MSNPTREEAEAHREAAHKAHWTMTTPDKCTMWNCQLTTAYLRALDMRDNLLESLEGHDTTHRGSKYPFCEDYGCSTLVSALKKFDGGSD